MTVSLACPTTNQHLVPIVGAVNAPARVIVVSAKLVVKLAAAIVAVALAWKRVPLGLPALSVSNLKFRFTDGLEVLQIDTLNVVVSTPVLITGNATLVLPTTSPIFCLLLATANVGQVSRNTHCPAVTASHII